MAYYPLFLDLAGKEILVVGAGAVGRRKIASLLAAGPERIFVADPGLDAETVRELRASGPVICLIREFLPQDLAGKTLVFASSGNSAVNAQVAALCASQGILCNRVDTPDSGSFIVPAHFTSGGITVALSTGGQSPALARRLRQDLEAWLGKRYSPLLAVLGRLRPLLLELHLPTEENTALFRALVCSPLADYLENGDPAAARAYLIECLPEALHSRVGELLHGF